MQTTHRLINQNARKMPALTTESIDLVVTSPPYPMIAMWDELFISQKKKIKAALKDSEGPLAFELMHQALDRVWDELYRVLKKGGLACINIGDATRTVGDRFALYANHARILNYMQTLGFSVMPAILWRKQTNAPNKFMGSGMLPAGAYVTLEHEYILILRKGGKREFTTGSEKEGRRDSAYFWEERNDWFSDVWMDLKGSRQDLADGETRKRSAAFPFELPYRLISMFSVKGDTVLDPFAGVGTTMLAAMAAARSSVNYEIQRKLNPIILSQVDGIVDFANRRIASRLENHLAFVQARLEAQKKFKYRNRHYLFPVITRQETNLLINTLKAVKQPQSNTFEVTYAHKPQADYVGSWEDALIFDSGKAKPGKKVAKKRTVQKAKQKTLFD